MEGRLRVVAQDMPLFAGAILKTCLSHSVRIAANAATQLKERHQLTTVSPAGWKKGQPGIQAEQKKGPRLY